MSEHDSESTKEVAAAYDEGFADACLESNARITRLRVLLEQAKETVKFTVQQYNGVEQTKLLADIDEALK